MDLYYHFNSLLANHKAIVNFDTHWLNTGLSSLSLVGLFTLNSIPFWRSKCSGSLGWFPNRSFYESTIRHKIEATAKSSLPNWMCWLFDVLKASFPVQKSMEHWHHSVYFVIQTLKYPKPRILDPNLSLITSKCFIVIRRKVLLLEALMLSTSMKIWVVKDWQQSMKNWI